MPNTKKYQFNLLLEVEMEGEATRDRVKMGLIDSAKYLNAGGTLDLPHSLSNQDGHKVAFLNYRCPEVARTKVKLDI